MLVSRRAVFVALLSSVTTASEVGISSQSRQLFGMATTKTHEVSAERSPTLTVTATPVDASKHSATVIVMHGLGDTAAGWIDGVMGFYAPAMPYAKFILPTAPTNPVTVNGGMPMPSWYDIEGFDGDRSTERCAGIEDSRATVEALIKAEKDAGIAANRIVVAGFSQGGAVSLFTGLQHAETLGGILSKSGYMPLAGSIAVTDAAKDTPVLMLHGEADPLVLPEWGVASFEAAKGFGVKDVKRKTYKGLEHSASPAELRDAAEWLTTVVPALE